MVIVRVATVYCPPVGLSQVTIVSWDLKSQLVTQAHLPSLYVSNSLNANICHCMLDLGLVCVLFHGCILQRFVLVSAATRVCM